MESFELEIYERTLPFDSASGSFSVVEDGVGTIATFAIEYDLKAYVPLNAEKVYRQNREKLLPLILAGLKHYVEKREPMPMPERANIAG